MREWLFGWILPKSLFAHRVRSYGLDAGVSREESSIGRRSGRGTKHLRTTTLRWKVAPKQGLLSLAPMNLAQCCNQLGEFPFGR